MVKNITRRKLLLGVALFGSSFFKLPRVHSSEKEILKIIFSDQNPPYSFVKKEETTGILPNLIKYIFSYDLKQNVEIFSLPWKRAQREVILEKFSGLCTFPSVARKEYIQFSKLPVAIQDKSYLFFSPKNPKAEQLRTINRFEDLNKFQMLGLLGVDWESQNLPDSFNNLQVPNIDIALKMIRNGRADFIINSLETVNYFERNIERRDRLNYVKLSSIPNSQVQYHFGLRKSLKGVDKIMSQFDENHQLVINTKTYNKLLNNSY